MEYLRVFCFLKMYLNCTFILKNVIFYTFATKNAKIQRFEEMFDIILPDGLFEAIDKHAEESIVNNTSQANFRQWEKIFMNKKVFGIDIFRKRTIYKYVTPYYEYAIKRQNTTKDSVLRDILIITTLNHENIVRTFGTKVVENKDYTTCWVIMEYLPISISFINLQDVDSFYHEKIKIILKDILLALRYMHEVKQTAHLDLKIGNVRGKFENGRIKYKLIDFGLSLKLICEEGKNIYEIRNKLSSIVGTFPFIPPEIYRSLQFGLQSDIYTLGYLAWCLYFKYENLQNEETICVEISNFLMEYLPKPDLKKIAWGDLNDFFEKCTAEKIEDRSTANILLEHCVFLN